MSELAPGHGGNGGLCFEDHICPPCEIGGPCMDLFVHPICGTVACNADDAVSPYEADADGGLTLTQAELAQAYAELAEPTVDWDSPTWGQPGSNVHEAAWAPDPKHADETKDE